MLERAPQNKQGKSNAPLAAHVGSFAAGIETKDVVEPSASLPSPDAIAAAQAEFEAMEKATKPVVLAHKPIGRAVCPRCKVACDLFAEGPEYDRKIRYEECRCGKGA